MVGRNAVHPPLSPAAPYSVEGHRPDDREDLYNQGIPFDEFLENAEKRRDRWLRNYENARVDEDLLERARAAKGTWRLLAVAVDSCSDSVSTIPFLARLVNQAPNLEMRIIDSNVGRAVMLDHPTPDGRSATPTIVLLNESFEEVGCFVERPATLQKWATENKEKLTENEYLKRKFAWYDEDAGRHTVEAIVELMEAASNGKIGC